MASWRIIIIGAGPTGLTAAIELARRGIQAELIDRKDGPSSLSRAVGILPSSLGILCPSGLTKKLLAAGIKIQKLQIYNGNQRLLSMPIRGAHPTHDYVITLAQDQTECLMRDVLNQIGGSVHYNTELIGLRQEQDQVIVTTQDGSETCFDYVLGADGIRSVTRNALDLDFPGFDLPETWSIADVDADGWGHPDTFTLCRLPQGQVTVVAPLEAKRYRVVSNTANALDTLPFNLNVTNIHCESTFNISIRQVTDYRVGRVFLAGDAAHCHSPVGGYGMNLGIADAAEFAQRLVNGKLDDYSASRHAEGQRTIAISERGRRLITARNPIKRAMVTFGLRMANHLNPIQSGLARRILAG